LFQYSCEALKSKHYFKQQRIRVECDLTNGDMPIGRAGEPIISAASADHKKAPEGFILSPWKLIATTALTHATTHGNAQRRTDDCREKLPIITRIFRATVGTFDESSFWRTAIPIAFLAVALVFAISMDRLETS
jgi:hypothetical protein